MSEAGSDVDLVIAFINTLDVEAGTDELATDASYQDWLESQSLPGGSLDLAREVRGALREAVTHDLHEAADGTVHNAQCHEVPSFASPPVEVSLACGVPTLTSVDGVGLVLAASARLAITGEWDRIKICPSTACLWAFYDTSRNQSKTWCSMKVCGNREKTRKFRERARAEETVSS